MVDKKQIDAVKELAKKYFDDASACHDWTHVQRVRNLALTIGKKEKADLQIIEIAVFLHDIGRKKEFLCKGKNKDGTKMCHAKEGAEEAQKILKDVDIDEKKKKNILHCISTHRFRNNNAPETIEAKVLFDADKLDSIGAVGVARAFVFVGYFNTIMYTGNEKELLESGKDFDFAKEDSAVLEYEKKLKHIKEKMLTKTGKKIARERHEFMTQFFERFWDEVNGLK